MVIMRVMPSCKTFTTLAAFTAFLPFMACVIMI
jgi:hypothetical protein